MLPPFCRRLAPDRTVPHTRWRATSRWKGSPLTLAVLGIASGLYLTTAMGPGPRDGLMTGVCPSKILETVRMSARLMITSNVSVDLALHEAAAQRSGEQAPRC